MLGGANIDDPRSRFSCAITSTLGAKIASEAIGEGCRDRLAEEPLDPAPLATHANITGALQGPLARPFTGHPLRMPEVNNLLPYKIH